MIGDQEMLIKMCTLRVVKITFSSYVTHDNVCIRKLYDDWGRWDPFIHSKVSIV